jgi:hypothetical protein
MEEPCRPDALQEEVDKRGYAEEQEQWQDGERPSSVSGGDIG